ncbi:hypothetical protein KC878_01865 [Candidatus Saccharibacteria bacterium]|nr:hypothetical protein [Candidatus Saccharibacteria bacterium]
MNYSSHRSQGTSKKRKAIVFWLVFLLIFIVAGVAVWLYLNRDQTQVVVKPGTQDSINVVAGEQTFSTPYFEFTTQNNWREIPEEMKRGDFYEYSQYSGDLPRRHLRVYVNPENRRYQVPFVLPVTLSGNRFLVGSISENCSKQASEDIDVGERMTILSGVTFLCDVDSTVSRIAVGLIGGGLQIPFESEANGKYTLTIEYNDVSFYPDDSALISILKSFRLK